MDVELDVDNGRCDTSAAARASFAVEEARGNWQRCDSDGDGTRNITDPIFLLGWLYLGGEAPRCDAAPDCNKDGAVDLTDVVYDLSFQFLGGPPPPPPYPLCDEFPGCPAAQGCGP